MNYEEKYKEALERARALIKANTSDALFHLKDIESIFPDLAESAGERIRKAIIEHLRQDIELEQILSEEIGSDWIAWLEKQGEQNLANSAKTCKNDEEIWSEEDERLCRCLIKDQKKALDEVRNDKYGHSEIISDLTEMYNERIAWLKSLKEKLVVK